MADEQQTNGMTDEELQMVGDGAEPDAHLSGAGTGAVAEEGEVSHAASKPAMTAEEAEVIEMADPGHSGDGIERLEQLEQAEEAAAADRMAAEQGYKQSPGPQDDSLRDRERVAAYDADDDTSDSGIDLVVVIVVLLVVLGCLIGSLVMAMNAPKQSSSQAQTKLEQEAQAQAEAEAEKNRLDVAELPEGVAAVVNGTEIPEVEVTDSIEESRVVSGLEDKDIWGQWLVAMGLTPDTLRENIISSMVNQELLEQAADNLGIVVTDEMIDEAYQETRDQFGTDEEWQEALDMNGLTEETFREQCVLTAKQQALQDKIYDEGEDVERITDDQVLENIKGYNTEYAEATSLDEVDAETADQMRQILVNNAKLRALNDYMDGFKESSDIKMSKMPSDAPYVVFLLPYYFSGMLADAGLEVSVDGQQAE